MVYPHAFLKFKIISRYYGTKSRCYCGFAQLKKYRLFKKFQQIIYLLTNINIEQLKPG